MSLLQSYKDRVKDRKDTEHQQALIRFIIVFVAFLYILTQYFLENLTQVTLFLVFGSLFISSALLAHIFLSPSINIMRRFVGVFHDALMTTLFLVFAEEKAALFLFAYPWVAIGNGFRYGVKYLYVSAGISSLCLLWILLNHPFWHEHQFFALGVLILNVAVTGYTAVLLTQLRDAQSEIEKMATHDSLTGLANRRLLVDRLKNSMLLNPRHSRCVGVVYFDLDGFKAVNDQHGHQAGDLLLKEVATKVQACIRETDTFARLGGDEFVIVLDSLMPPTDPTFVARRILKAIESIEEIEGKKIKISASIGLAKLTQINETIESDPELVIKSADEAMYKAKKTGKGRIELVEV